MDEIVKRLEAAQRLLLVTHARPDGDALGSMAALALSAGSAGRSVRMCIPDIVPARYEFLFEADRPVGVDQFEALADEADAVVVVDTCAFSQLDGLEAHLRGCRDKVCVIDHHATYDDFAAVRWTDTSAASAGVMVGELIEHLGWPIGRAAAEALTIATVTDTGWLVFANTDSRCLCAVARWLDKGVRTDELYRRLYQSDRPERLRLMTRLLESLELHCNSRLAMMTLREKDFTETGARSDETDNLVNEALRIGCVEEAILLVENGGQIRVSLRSRNAIDVAAIAGKFGGGGHVRAAGFRSHESIDSLKQRLIATCKEAMAQAGIE